MDTLLFALNAVLPIIIFIALGYFLRKINFLNQNFLDIANKFVFRIALPALLFYSIYSVSSLNDINYRAMIFAAVGLVTLFIIALIATKIFIKEKKQKAIIIQGAVNANFAIIGIPLAEAIGGGMAVANVALLSLIALPLMNGFSVVVLSLYNDRDERKNVVKNTLIKVLSNPPIIGVIIGFFVILLRTYIPISSETNDLVFSLERSVPFIFTVIRWLANIASPLALIVLGATFRFSLIKKLKQQIILGTILRSVLIPILVFSFVILLSNGLLNFDINIYTALIAIFASPTAIATAVLAKELHSDENLAVQLVVWTTLASIITIFSVILIFREMGFI